MTKDTSVERISYIVTEACNNKGAVLGPNQARGMGF